MAKKYKESRARVEDQKLYDLNEAFQILDQMQKAKFDESVDVAVRLGVDPRQSDQMVRGTVVLPNGLGKKVRVLVFAKGEKEREATEAGADFVGAEDLIEKIEKESWFDFDRVISTPDMMATVSKIGRVLGPRGLMPNPKLGTVTFDIEKAVREAKAGKVDFRVEKAAVVHAPIGRRSFGADKLRENFLAMLDAIQKLKPATAKGTYLRGVSVSSTMSPGIRVDVSAFVK